MFALDKVSGLSATGEAKLRWQKDQTQYKQAKQQERYSTADIMSSYNIWYEVWWGTGVRGGILSLGVNRWGVISLISSYNI